MLPKERVIAALEHREPDRIPWGEHSIDYNVYEMILGRETLVQSKFRETQAYWDGRRDEVVAHYKRDLPDLVRALEMDIVPVHPVPASDYRPAPFDLQPDGSYRDPESERIFRISSVTGDLMEQPVVTAFRRTATVEDLEEEIEDLRQEPELDPMNSEYEAIRHMVAELGQTHFIMALFNGLEFPRYGETEEESWMNLVEHPDICEKIAELQGVQMLREARLCGRLGVDGLMAVGDLGSSSGMLASPRIYRKMCYPWQKLQAEEARKYGLKVLRHSCGHCMPVINELAEIYDCYEAIQPTAGMDVRVLKEKVGDRLCLWGGIWHEHIHDGTPEQIREDARYAYQYAGKGGGFIMGSSHSLAVGATLENILEMKRCRDEWGVYPLKPEGWK
jgi:uroporphyrinogen decarboxylase